MLGNTFFTVNMTEYWHRLPKEVVELFIRDTQKLSGHGTGQLGLRGLA